jgi:hypothetical protein
MKIVFAIVMENNYPTENFIAGTGDERVHIIFGVAVIPQLVCALCTELTSSLDCQLKGLIHHSASSPQ